MAGAIDLTSPAAYAARFSAWDGGELAIVTPRAFPPGAPLEGTIDGHPLRLKVNRCRRLPTGEEFVVVGRPVDLRRETREALGALAAANPEAGRIPRW
jgi:hypothetical protein